ncbi:MAG: hypothetical protein ACLTCB_01675 [Merdibacter sp.]
MVWDCLNAGNFSVCRIHQLGGDFLYHTAEHTRFSHSLGVYEIVRRGAGDPGYRESFGEYEKCTAMLAGFCDIGHGRSLMRLNP